MGVMPTERLGKIEWCELRAVAGGPWATNFAAIGVAVGDVTLLETRAAAARDAYTAHLAAQAAAKAATVAYYEAVKTMAAFAMAQVSKIRSKAAVDGSDQPYVLSQVPPPATPSPVGPPGTPNNLKVTLNPDGSLVLKWACANPTGASGTIYQIYRRSGAGAFAPVGASGKKEFVDATVPAGVASVTYRIQAIRSTQAGTANEFTVNFGVGGGGEFLSASVGPDEAAGGAVPKMAA
jgi:hypothetical protein